MREEASAEGRADLGDPPACLTGGQRAWLVLHAPHRPQGLWVALEAGHEVPVDMRHEVAQELVVHLDRPIDTRQGPRDPRDVLDQGRALDGIEFVELDGMTLEDHEDPAGEELVLVEVDAARGQVGDEERPGLGEPGAHEAVPRHRSLCAKYRPIRWMASSIRSRELA